MEISPAHSDRDAQTLPISPRRDSLAHLDQSNFPVGIKSCFSEENEDSKSERGDDPDILQMAEQQDGLKASRDDLVIRMSITGKMPSVMSRDAENYEDSPEHKPNSPTRKSFNVKTHSYHFDRKTVSDTDGSAKNKKEDQNANLLDAEVSEDFDGNLDEKISEEPPRPAMPQNNTVHSISDEFKSKAEMSQSVRVIPEANFTGSSRPAGPRSFPGGLPAIEGYLQKKSTNILGLWLRRYYVLKNKKLYYYNNERKEVKSGVIDFDLISVKLEVMEDKKLIKIAPAGGSRVFLFRAKTEEEAEAWREAIEKHIKVSHGYVRALCKVVKLKNFWKSDRMSDVSFLNQADTGDILLFKTKNIGATIQRSFTWSEYDHVALLLRFSSGDIVLFEATGKTGVGLCRWSTFMKSKWHLLYSKIAYRKLTVKRSEELISGIESFVKYSVGKKYKVSARKLLKKTEASDSENSETRTFFCSELVAACYKRVGLLPPDMSAARYLPGTFAAEKKLQLTGGAKLEDECLVDFEI